MHKQNYIHSSRLDWAFILMPPFLCLLLVFVFQGYFNLHSDLSPMHWLILVMMIDVSHVYSTIYRTYLDPTMQKNHKLLLYGIPMAVWLVGIGLCAMGDLVFWRVMAYLAVFHFIRQQYGFFQLYGRNEPTNKLRSIASTTVIYAATLYPVLVWHLTGAKNFTWFVENDFLITEQRWLIPYLGVLYLVIWGIYLFFEIREFFQSKFFNVPKNMILLGTALSWYFGIVYFNSDLIFTLLNVVSHGVPYMALVWVYGHKKLSNNASVFSRIQLLVFTNRGVLLFILVLIGFAFFEETLWDSFVWHDYPQYFGFTFFWGTEIGQVPKVLLVSLLAVPQVTHYILDGFIWKIRTQKAELSAVS